MLRQAYSISFFYMHFNYVIWGWFRHITFLLEYFVPNNKDKYIIIIGTEEDVTTSMFYLTYFHVSSINDNVKSLIDVIQQEFFFFFILNVKSLKPIKRFIQQWYFLMFDEMLDAFLPALKNKLNILMPSLDHLLGMYCLKKGCPFQNKSSSLIGTIFLACKQIWTLWLNNSLNHK